MKIKTKIKKIKKKIAIIQKMITQVTEEEKLFKKSHKYYYNIEQNKYMKYSAKQINKSKKTNKLSHIIVMIFNVMEEVLQLLNIQK